MNELLLTALTEAATAILQKVAAGETINRQELEIVTYACRANKPNPLQTVLDAGQTLLPLFFSTGGIS